MAIKRIGLLFSISLLSLFSLSYLNIWNKIEEFVEKVDSCDDLFGKSIEASNQKLNSKEDLVLPKLGVQYAYTDTNSDGINDYISIRYTAAVKSLDVTAIWTRAMYDKDGKVFEALKEKTVEVTKGYTAVTQNGEITYANTIKGENNTTPYNYFLVYTLKNIPLDSYKDYYLDCMLEISDGENSVKSTVGAFKCDTTNYFSYNKVSNLVATKEDNHFTVINYPNLDTVTIPTYYSNQDYRLKIENVDVTNVNDKKVKSLVLDNNVLNLTGIITKEDFNGIYYKGEKDNLSLESSLADYVYYYSDTCKNYKTFHYVGSEISLDYTHNPTEVQIENDTATCLEDGTKDLVTYCTDCGKELSRETVVSTKKGHSYIETLETLNGYSHTKHECQYCHDFYYDALVIDYTKNYDYQEFMTNDIYSEYKDVFSVWYDELYNACMDVLNSSTDYTNSTKSIYASSYLVCEQRAVFNFISSFMDNNPQFYFLSNQYSVSYYNTTPVKYCPVVFIDSEFYNHEVRKELEANLLLLEKDVSSNLEENMTDYDKALMLHDYLCSHSFYQYLADGTTPSNSISAHSIVGIADMNESTGTVCEGYAKAYLYLSRLIGLDSVIVVGSAGSGELGGHAWNYTKIDDTWYAVDVTWDDQDYISYDFFLTSKSFMDNAGYSWGNASHVVGNSDITTDGFFQVVLPELSLVAYSN